jgi:hypothetical protein
VNGQAVRIAQAIAVLPSVATVGFMLVVGMLAVLGSPSSALRAIFQGVGIGGTIAAAVATLLLLVLFAMPVLGFVCLGILLFKGPPWVADRHRLAGIVVAAISLSCIIGLWFLISDGKRTLSSPFTVYVVLAPIVVGAVNVIALIREMMTWPRAGRSAPSR